MKLLIITGDFPPFLTGVGDYTDKLAAALSQMGADVTVLTSTSNTASSKVDDTHRRFKVRRVVPEWNNANASLVLNYCQGYDIINLQYPGVHYKRSPMINLLPWQIRRKLKPTLCVPTIHDFRVMRSRWRARSMPMLLGAHALLHVDAGDWPAIQKWMPIGKNKPHACIPIASNVDVVPCSPDDRARWRSELQLADDELGIAYFGIIYPHKGVDELIDSVTTLRKDGIRARAVIIGDFDREEDWVHRLRNRLQTSEGVSWVPGASLERVSQCLHACDLAALPFHSGTSVNRSSMLAALGHGLPTVTTRGHVTPANIEQLFDLVLVEPQNNSQLTDALRTLCTDENARTDLAKKTRNRAAGNTWQAAARSTLDFFEQLLADRKAKP